MIMIDKKTGTHSRLERGTQGNIVKAACKYRRRNKMQDRARAKNKSEKHLIKISPRETGGYL